MSDDRKVEFFGISTCGWCRKTREWLDSHNVLYHVIYLDQVSGEEKENAKARVMKYVERISVPIIIVNEGEKVIQGYKPEEYEECLK
jgi:glutaredoxin-like protein NrdH